MSQQVKPYTDEQLKEIAEWSVGRSVRETCERFGCHNRIVLRARVEFIDAETEWPTSGRRKMEVSQSDVDMMQRMREDGLTISDVAAFTGFSRKIVESRTKTPKKKEIYRTKTEPVKNWTLKSKRPEMQEMRNSGVSVQDVAEHFNCSVSTVTQNTKAPEASSISISSLGKRYREGRPLSKNIDITLNGEIIGTFIPKESAH